ncbi:CRISPR-associated protein, Csx12 family [Saccharolobus shibatae B12]|uniref:CRISPR-associated protein, Csx12 family n=1 Tax=Saccharolobus shibatae (strain ATCC 51178 / DSM 5389 / JCM 8931 / NBRC 15437 / B12) TaxID=523848 RepID=A0A8F5BQA9_SACSH|nr:CRISPR-associated ring nuclease Crn1 [Saccharolobus shibatae]QXJ29365.1 CRISPR-associated protein, Csx12 family [Saccharolobus shibatae B12]
MVKLVATLGTSPGGVIESFLYLVRKGQNIDEIRVVTTTNAEVKKAWKIVRLMFICCIQEKFPKVEISEHPLDIEDIYSEEDLKKVKEFIEKQLNEGDYLDITGGRKSMSVAAALAAKNRGAKIITSIISQDDYNRISKRVRELKDIVEIKNRSECSEQIRETYCSLIVQNARTIEFEI